MDKYRVNNLESTSYEKLITLLDYREQISDCLKNITVPLSIKSKVLVDAALVSGLNSFRFIEVGGNEEGALSLTGCPYPEVDEEIVRKANFVLRNEPVWVENSILTKTQKKSIERYAESK